MNKQQAVDELAKLRYDGDKKAALKALESVLDLVVRTTVKGDRISITGFGAFEKVDRPARYARNPQTGERVRVKKTKVPVFRPGQGFKDLVKGEKKIARTKKGEPVPLLVAKAPKGSLQTAVNNTTKKGSAK